MAGIRTQDAPKVKAKSAVRAEPVKKGETKTTAEKPEYEMVQLAPGKMVKKVREAPVAVGSKVNGGAAADTVVGSYNDKHEYSEKTPPEKAGDKYPQGVFSPGSVNEKYEKKGTVMQAPAVKTAPAVNKTPTGSP